MNTSNIATFMNSNLCYERAPHLGREKKSLQFFAWNLTQILFEEVGRKGGEFN